METETRGGETDKAGQERGRVPCAMEEKSGERNKANREVVKRGCGREVKQVLKDRGGKV